MINALNPNLLVRVIAFATLAVSVLAMLITGGTSPVNLVQLQGWIVLTLSLLTIALSFPPVLHALHTLSWAKVWWFPWLGGKWKGKVRSNWPTVAAMLAASRGEGPRFDPFGDDPPPSDPVDVEVTITCGLFDIIMDLRVPGTRRVSRTLFVKPVWCRPHLPVIHYAYDQTDFDDVKPTDSRSHFGAGQLTYDEATDELRGEYWTERQGTKGLNTAGTLILKRVKPRR